MTDPNLDTVRSAYAAFGRGDIPAVLATMAPDVEWVESQARGLPARGTHIGPQQVAQNVFSAVPQDWAEFALVPEDFFADGDTVIVRGRVKAVARATGRSMDAPFVHVFTVADAKIQHLTNHHDTALWVQALGT